MSDDVAQVRKHLADIPELTLEASHYLTPGTAPKDPDVRHATNIHKIPIVAEIADLLDQREKDVDEPALNRMAGERRLGVLPTLGVWVSLVYAELADMGDHPRDCCSARNHTITGEAAWLSEYAEAIIELHPEFPRDIEQLWLELRKACRIRKTYQPRCPHCNNHIQGVYGSTEDAAPAWWRCTGCGKTWVHDAEVQRLALTQPPMTLRQIAGLLSISCRDIYRWHEEGRFMPVQSDHRGRKLFEIEQIKRAARAIGRQIA